MACVRSKAQDCLDFRYIRRHGYAAMGEKKSVVGVHYGGVLFQVMSLIFLLYVT